MDNQKQSEPTLYQGYPFTPWLLMALDPSPQELA